MLNSLSDDQAEDLISHPPEDSIAGCCLICPREIAMDVKGAVRHHG